MAVGARNISWMASTSEEEISDGNKLVRLVSKGLN